MTSRIDFVASASATLTTNTLGTVGAMPAVDGSNVDVVVTNSGASPIMFQFGTSSNVLSGPGCPSSLQIDPGQQLLFTSPATAASAAQPANVSPTGAAAGAATYCGLTSMALGGTLVIQRGTSTAKNSF